MTPNELLDRLVKEAEQETFLYFIARIRESLGIDLDNNSILNLAAFMGLSGLMATMEYKGEPAALDVFNHNMDVYQDTMMKTVVVKLDRMKAAAVTLSDIMGTAEAPAAPAPEPEDLRVHTEPMKWTDNATVRNLIQAVQRDGATEVRYSGDLPGEYFCVPVTPEGKELALCILRTDEFNKLRAWLKNVSWVDVKKNKR